MYNENQKRKYIQFALDNSTTKYPEVLEKSFMLTFSNAEIYEELYRKDLADMNYEELKITMSRISSISYSSRRIVSANVHNYIEWAIGNGFSTQSENIASLIKIAELDNSQHFQNMYIYSPQELVDKCNILFTDYKEQKRDSIIRCVLYLEFCGFIGKNICKIKNSEIDIMQHTIQGVKIYDEFWDALIYMSNLEYYIYPLFGREAHKKVTNPEYLVKILSTSIMDYTKKRMSELRKVYRDETGIDIFLKQSVVKYSGILYRALQQEIQTGSYDTSILKANKIPLNSFKKDFERYKEVALKR